MATGAATDTTTMIFGLVTPEKVSNRSIKLDLGALNDSFEVGSAPAEQNRSQRSRSLVYKMTQNDSIYLIFSLLDPTSVNSSEATIES